MPTGSHSELVAHISQLESQLADARSAQKRSEHEADQQRHAAGRRLTLLKTLHSLNMAVFANLSEVEIYRLSCETIVRQLGWTSAYVVTFTAGKGMIRASAGSNQQRLDFLRDHFSDNPVITNAYLRRAVISTANTSDPESLALRVLFGCEDGVAVPMQFGETCIGYVVATSAQPVHSQSHEDVDFLMSIASLLTHAVQQSANYLDLEAQNKKLKQLDELKDSFISITSHQLRTPLSIIKWIMSILQTDKVLEEHPEQLQLVGQAYETNERLIHVVNDLLNVSRIQEGKLPYNPQLADLVATIHEQQKNAQRLFDAKKITLELAIPEHLPPVMLDSILFKEAFQGLLDNAMDYNLDESGWVRLQAEQTSDQIVITIANPGPGIEPEESERIFEQFYRSPRAVGMHPNGNGLGLYLARAIINEHGGSLHFSSESADTGTKITTFVITLPIPHVAPTA
jgi:signal transduction histidine kinase